MSNPSNTAPEKGAKPRADVDTRTARTVTALAGVLGAATLIGIGSPAAPALRFGHAELSTGVRLRYAEHGDADGTPVIMLHGYSDTWYSFSMILPKLSPRIHAYALDQRGHGDSDKPAEGYAMRDLAADVLAFMDAKGIKKATVLGHSMGSFVAQQVAVAAPARVERLVLVASGPHISGFNSIDELDAAVQTLTDPVPLEFTREFQVSTIFQPVPAAFVDRVSEDSRRLPASAWRALMRGMYDMEPANALRNQRMPTLLIWGDKDAIVPRSSQDSLLGMLPDSRLTVYERTGHAVHWERPDRFARELEAFVGPR